MCCLVPVPTCVGHTPSSRSYSSRRWLVAMGALRPASDRRVMVSSTSAGICASKSPKELGIVLLGIALGYGYAVAIGILKSPCVNGADRVHHHRPPFDVFTTPLFDLSVKPWRQRIPSKARPSHGGTGRRPVSQNLTAVRVTPRVSASSCWVSPSARRAVRSSSGVTVDNMGTSLPRRQACESVKTGPASVLVERSRLQSIYLLWSSGGDHSRTSGLRSGGQGGQRRPRPRAC